MRRTGLPIATALLALAAVSAHAQTYTSRSAFLTALPGPSTTLNFDSTAAGTVVASGGALGGITFTYTSSVQLKVTGAYPAVSGANALGSTDGDILQDGDNISFSFTAKNAFGLVIITKEALQNGDLSLSAGGSTATISASAIVQTLSDGSNVYFLGVVKPTATFTTATLSTVGGGYFFYNLDDLVTATTVDTDGDGVPDPQDNCINVANADQYDANGDGYGNVCDADLDNNGTITATDFAILRGQLGKPVSPGNLADQADLDHNGAVTATDFALLRKALGGNPGPSGLHPNCPPTCP